MAFLIPHYYRRRFNPEIDLNDITNSKSNLEPILHRLRDLDNSLRHIVTRVSRNYNIPIPGAGMGISTLTSPTSPTGDMTRDSARLLLLYLRAVLSKGYFRELERTWMKLEKFEKAYWDEDEGEQTNTGFWKRLELGDEMLEEGIAYVNRWKETKDREREWWPKMKEMEDAIREGKRWEQDVGLRRNSVSSSTNGSVAGSEISTSTTESLGGSVGGGGSEHRFRGSFRNNESFRASMRGSVMVGFKLNGGLPVRRNMVGSRGSSLTSAGSDLAEDSESERGGRGRDS